jgi:S-adenosylmethionine synthetase
MHRNYLFSSESVARGHPDKIADQIADAILDELLGQDPEARVACEALVTTGLAFVSGEIHTEKAYAEIPALVRRTIARVGYNDPTYGFDSETCGVLVSIDEQSADIAKGVLSDRRIGAGDQGIMFGYATDETPELMPLPIMLAHKLMIRLEEVRVKGVLPWLRPDGKGQVAVRYEDDRPTWIDAIILSAQHAPDVSIETLREGLRHEVIFEVLPPEMYDPAKLTLHINPTGRFVEGGPKADTGLTGRKIIVDTYGGMAPHGGGSFSGKDPTKVDRSGTYAARWVAKNVVAAGLAARCLIQIAYAIGVAEPVSIAVETYGTGRLPNGELERRIRKAFDLTPLGIINGLKLRRPIYEQTAFYGHFGRDLPDFTWERTNRIGELQKEG